MRASNKRVKEWCQRQAVGVEVARMVEEGELKIARFNERGEPEFQLTDKSPPRVVALLTKEGQ